MTAFLLRMPAGIPGVVTRLQSLTAEPQVLWPAGTTGAFPAYGLAGIIDATTFQFRVVKAGDTRIDGVLIRPYPIQTPNVAFGAGAPPDGAFGDAVCDVMKRGYMTVLLGGTTAAFKEAPVFVRLAGAATGKVIGDFEAAADGGNTLALTNCVFTGPADASGNVEIRYNI